MASVFDRDDLDLKLGLLEPEIANDADFTDRRDLALKQFMADYAEELRVANDGHRVYNTYSMVTPPSIGTEKVDSIIGDVYKVGDLPTDFDGINGDIILIKDGTDLRQAARIEFDNIIMDGVDDTLLAFLENTTSAGVREVLIYQKDGEIADASVVHFEYNRKLDDVLAAGTDKLDIKDIDFQRGAEAIAEYMKKNV